MKKIVISISLITITLISILLMSNILFAQPFGYSTKPTITGSGGRVNSSGFILNGPATGQVLSWLPPDPPNHSGIFILDSENGDQFFIMMPNEVFVDPVTIGTASGFIRTASLFQSPVIHAVGYPTGAGSLSITDSTGNGETIYADGDPVSNIIHTISGATRSMQGTTYFNDLRVGTSASPAGGAGFFVNASPTEIRGTGQTHIFKNHSGYSGSNEYRHSGGCQTSGAVTGSCNSTWTLTDSTSCTIEVRVSGRTDSSGADRAGYVYSGTVYREGGNAILLGQTAISTQESNASWGAALATTLTSVTLASVTGVAATTINWTWYATLHCTGDDL